MDSRDDDSMKMQAQLRLMCELAEGIRSGEEEGWISSDDVRKHFETRTYDIGARPLEACNMKNVCF